MLSQKGYYYQTMSSRFCLVRVVELNKIIYQISWQSSTPDTLTYQSIKLRAIFCQSSNSGNKSLYLILG